MLRNLFCFTVIDFSSICLNVRVFKNVCSFLFRIVYTNTMIEEVHSYFFVVLLPFDCGFLQIENFLSLANKFLFNSKSIYFTIEIRLDKSLDHPA